MTYAASTSVSVERSRAEIDTLLAKHKATQRGIVADDEAGRALVLFTLDGRQYRLEVPLPKLADFQRGRFGGVSYDRDMSADLQAQRYEQACRVRWRAVVLLLKGKLEIVALGVTTYEREFLADLVLPNGQSVHHALADRIKEAYASGKMPPLMLGPAP